MDPDFWHERWNSNRTGFHQNEINPYLKKHWPSINPKPNGRILVPLCGKSLDILWLHEQGHPVTGVELSPVAVESFFSENGLEPVRKSKGPFQSLAHNGIELLCGDFFSLSASHLPGISGVYDRAAMVALPPNLRIQYADLLGNFLPSGAGILLITLDYPQPEMEGPPFSVPETEVHQLFQNNFAIHCLESQDVLSENPRLQSHGVTRLHETIYRLERL